MNKSEAKQIISGIESEAMRKRVLRAFGKLSVDGPTRDNRAHPVFERGQWWIKMDNGQIFACEDADGPGSYDGLTFEEIN